jgi:NosR/NirI family nitrous oxide reductase transcriptional regulator
VRRALVARVLTLVTLVVLGAGSLVGSRLHAQQIPSSSSPALPTEPASVGAEPAAAGDAWNFSDEEAAPTWGQTIRTQAFDLGLTVAFFALALVSFFRKSAALKYVTMAASIAYLGVMRSELFSVVDLFKVLNWDFPVFRFTLPWYLFAGFTVVSTVLFGRLYCGRICAFGSLTQLMDQVVPKRLRVEVPDAIERRAAWIKYGLLAFTIAYFLLTRDHLIFRYVEPFWMFSGHGSVIMWSGLAVLLVATVFVRNLYCRFLCPVGAFLGILSNLTVFKIKRWSECKSCKICEKTCQWGAIRGPEIIKSECVRCDDCERLYLDQKKCPHWIIIRRKSEVMARQSAAPAR